MERFEDKVNVMNFAQLAMDCYNDPKDDIYRAGFNRSWMKVDEWPRKNDPLSDPKKNGADKKTGFYSSFYINSSTIVGIIAIRGTSSVIDYLVDGEYVLDIPIKQYEEALKYISKIRALYPNVKKLYVCGHSLGGIVAKMIAPRTGLNTVAFNSPGVVQFLKAKNLPYFRTPVSDAMCAVPMSQTVITYCANGCPIGNLRHDNDVGVYKWLPVLGEERIPDNKDRIDGKNLVKGLLDMSNGIFDANDVEFDKGLSEIPEFDKAAVNARLVKYHLISDMYKALKSSKYKDDRI